MLKEQLDKMDTMFEYLASKASTTYYVVKYNGKVISSRKGQTTFKSKGAAKVAINASLFYIYRIGFVYGVDPNTGRHLYMNKSNGLWTDNISYIKGQKAFYKQFWDKYLTIEEVTLIKE